MANIYIEKLKISDVVRDGDCQEVFFMKETFKGKKSIKIRGIKQDIGAMLKKSFLGGKSKMEIHYLHCIPVKIYLDGVLLCELGEDEYPKALKDSIRAEAEDNERFLKIFDNFLQNYPKKSNLQVAIFKLPLWMRAYAGCLLWKSEQEGKLDNDLHQRKLSLLIDLLTEISVCRGIFIFVERWSVRMAEEGLLFFNENSITQEAILHLKLAEVAGYEKIINQYLSCLFLALGRAYSEDSYETKAYLSRNFSILSDRTIDRSLLMENCSQLRLYRPLQVENYLADVQITSEEVMYYLSMQNW